MALPHTRLLASLVVIALLVSFPTIAQAERHKQVASSNTHCEINCLNGGYCSFAKYTDYPRKGDVGYYQNCVCRPGFGGPSCENTVDECQPPYYKCHNGAPCEKQENGSLGCECSFADIKSELAGYMCRKSTIQACDTLDENNKSFCTNGGVCLSSMTVPSNHLVFSDPTVHEGCQCDRAFSGDHCEFIEDMPESSLTKAASSGKSAGAKAGITLSVLAAIAIFGVLSAIQRKQRLSAIRRENRVCLDQSKSWEDGVATFQNFSDVYLEKLAKDSMVGDDDNDQKFVTKVAIDEDYGKREEEGKEEDDIQSMLEIII